MFKKKNRCKTYAVYAFFETEYVPVNAELWSSVISHSIIVHSGLAVHLFCGLDGVETIFF